MIRASWPRGGPGYILLGLVLVGVVLRVVAIASWWPTTTMLADGYELSTSNPFTNPLHPAGYSLIIASIGLISREIAVPVVLQHVSGIASALMLWAATRRITNSEWAGLLPAGIVLLGPDFIYVEHAIVSESSVVLMISVGLYSAVRALDAPDPYWRWPLLTGAALALAVTIRTAAVCLILITILALIVIRPWSDQGRRAYWRAALAALSASAVILLTFATLNATLGDRFGVGASPGWYLYARAAQFADCTQFTPPEGTNVLCESRPANERPGSGFYVINPRAPSQHFFGPFGNDDDLLGEWAKRAILAQPRDYIRSVWETLRGYWIPDLRSKRPASGGELDPQLAFTNGLKDSGFYSPLHVSFIQSVFQASLETYYNKFTVHMYDPGLGFLRGWQRIIRFGAIALSVTTVLVLLGLAIGTRRSRVGVLLFGIGGLALIILPALTANYYGRYTIPMAGPLMAAAAIAIVGLLRSFRARVCAHDRAPEA